MRYFIQIEDARPFPVEMLEGTGVVYGEQEATKANDRVRSFRISSKVAIARYLREGIEFVDYYREGKWIKINETDACFCVSGLLEHTQ